jgi:Bax protein
VIVQNFALRKEESGAARKRALRSADVPLLAPALSLMASALVAVSVVSLASPWGDQTEAAVEPSAQTQLVHPAAPAAFTALDAEMRTGPSELADASTIDIAMAEIAPPPFIGNGIPADMEGEFARRKEAGRTTRAKALPRGLADKALPVSLEIPHDIAAAATSPAVFDGNIAAMNFLPAPTKPRLFDDTAAAAAVQMPLPKPNAKSAAKSEAKRFAKPIAKPVHAGPTASVAALDAHFERIDYDLASVRAAQDQVPRLYLDKLPEDIADEPSVAMRKRVFIKSILPVVLRVNEDILAARKKLKKVRATLDSGMSLTEDQRSWLYQIAERYQTDPYDWPELMARVDIVPPSLAIAQAAEESGWGTSRFAREGNALFGQYTYKATNGMLPEERANGRRHLIRAYSSLVDGVRSYMHNLNYHRAYSEFRAARKWLRNHDELIDGHTLAGELIRYSERGADYVKTLRRIIRANRLAPLDRARLHEDRWTNDDANRRDLRS